MLQQAWISMTAAQGTTKDMKKMSEPWSKTLKAIESEGNDAAAFIARFGGGI